MMGRFLLTAALVAVVAGCGAASSSEPGGEGPSVITTRRPQTTVTTRIVGATSQQRAILLEALAGIGTTRIQVIEVSPAEKGWNDDPKAIGLGFSVGDEDLDTRSEWESWLVTQALAVRSSELDLPVIAYAGGRGIGQSAVGKASPRKAEPALTDSETKEIGQRVDQAARAAGAEVVKVEVLEPLGPAVAITLRVSDPAQFLQKRVDGFMEDLGGPPNTPEAGDRYLRVVDENGSRIMEVAGASEGEGSSGAGWVRPDLIGCYDPAMSRPFGWEPPPCTTEAADFKPAPGS